MEQQNSNMQNNPSNTHNTAQANGQHTSSLNNVSEQQKNENSQNMRPKPNQERRPNQDNRNQNRDKNNRPNDRNRQKDNRYAQKNRDQKSPERPKENASAARSQQSTGGASGYGANHQNKSMKSAHHGESMSRPIKTKRIETLEDIKADIERVEKDIQLEIKQIRAIKLGL